jgi:hypothetical protein
LIAGGLVLLAARRSGHPLAGHLHQLIPDLRIRRQACKPDAILRISFHPSVSCHGAPPIRNPLTRPPIMIGYRKKFTGWMRIPPKKCLYASVPLLETEVVPILLEVVPILLTARRLSFAGVGRRPKSRSDPGGAGSRCRRPLSSVSSLNFAPAQAGAFCGPQRSRPGRNTRPSPRTPYRFGR